MSNGKGILCQMCGNKGWEQALIFCAKCLIFAIHRYCLPVMPETDDEFVQWVCIDCEEKYGKPCSLQSAEIVSLGTSEVVEDRHHIPAQPFIDQIWSGNFDIKTSGYGSCDGLVAYLSSKACSKASDEAKFLTKTIYLELLSKTSVWPNKFQNLRPTDEDISLYFFALDKSNEGVLDGLISNMTTNELALRAVLAKAELLIFASHELPLKYWKLNGNFYLWGVFREIQPLSGSSNCQLMMQNEENYEDRNLTSKSSNALSQISPLSIISIPGLRWTPPDVGEFKVNVSASVISDKGAVGGIIRDSNGGWVHGFFMHFGNILDISELNAIFQGLKVAAELGLHKLIVESDSENAVEAIANAGSDYYLYCYVEVIRKFLERGWSCRINWVSRDVNSCACRLTQEAFSSPMKESDLVEPPEFMSTFLAADLLMGDVGTSSNAV